MPSPHFWSSLSVSNPIKTLTSWCSAEMIIICSRKNPDLVSFTTVYENWVFRLERLTFNLPSTSKYVANGSKNNVYGCYEGEPCTFERTIKLKISQWALIQLEKTKPFLNWNTCMDVYSNWKSGYMIWLRPTSDADFFFHSAK